MFILIPRAPVSAGGSARSSDRAGHHGSRRAGRCRPPSRRPGASVEFRDVEFGYPGPRSRSSTPPFVARPGETTAIVGSTGSGKTTLINLIPRLYDVTRVR